MIGEVTTLVTPTQYVILRVTPDAGGWEDGVSLRLYAQDTVTTRDFTVTEVLEESNAVVMKIGPFVAPGEAALTLSLRDDDDALIDSWTDNVSIINDNSPAVIVRQAFYDIIEAAEIDETFLLSDGLHRPASAAEDVPFVANNSVIELGAPSSKKAKKTQVRSDVTCEVPLSIYVFGYSTGEAFNIADNIAWRIQCAVDAAPNLYLSSLGMNNFTWVWDVRPPDFVEVQGSSSPVVVQELSLSASVIWMSPPNQS